MVIQSICLIFFLLLMYLFFVKINIFRVINRGSTLVGLM